jgi:hypothetical protein
MQRRTPTTDELKRGLSTVYDEIGALYTWYIWWVYARTILEDDDFVGKTSGHYVILNNAALHSSVMATRKLAEFFKVRPKNQEKDDDLRAYDFPGFDGLGDIMREDLTEIHKRVAHMTYREIEAGPASYQLKIAVEELLLPRCLIFLEYLEHTFFADDEDEKDNVRKVRSGIIGMTENWNKISELLKQ